MTIAFLVALGIVFLALLVGWIVHTVDRVKPFYAQRSPSRREIKRWLRTRTITVVPRRKAS